MTEEPIKAFVIAYDGVSPHGLTIPAEVLARAERELDEARERRRLAAEADEIARKVEAARKPASLWQRFRDWMRSRR